MNKTKLKNHADKLKVNLELKSAKGEIQVRGVKLLMISKAELENPEYETNSFGMITYKACALIARTSLVWIPLLNEEMKKEGFSSFVTQDENELWRQFFQFWKIIEADSNQGMYCNNKKFN